jgi:ketosteroid isomerase-like protein
MKPFQPGLTKIVAGTLLGLALISVIPATETGNALSDSEQLMANEKAWAQAGQLSDADRMASYMAEEYVELVWETATASAPAHWSSTRKNGKDITASGIYADTWLKRNGRWLLIHSVFP